MAITFDNDGKPAYMFKQGETSADGVWYAVGAKIDTSAAYEFTGANSFTNTVLFDDFVTAEKGFNNFLNPAARDAALATPVQGTIVFVRQDAGGNALNQIQFYDGSAWVGSGDIFGVTAGTGISGGGTSGTVTVSIDDTVVATTSNTLTMSNKTLTDPKITLTYSAKTDDYTFASGDEGKVFSMNAATAKEFRIPTDATFNFGIGTQFNVFWITGAGQPAIVAVTPGTTTVISTGATSASPNLRVANSMATCLKIAANSWVVTGDVA
jgi:hypothetical protein